MKEHEKEENTFINNSIVVKNKINFLSLIIYSIIIITTVYILKIFTDSIGFINAIKLNIFSEVISLVSITILLYLFFGNVTIHFKDNSQIYLEYRLFIFHKIIDISKINNVRAMSIKEKEQLLEKDYKKRIKNIFFPYGYIVIENELKKYYIGRNLDINESIILVNSIKKILERHLNRVAGDF